MDIEKLRRDGFIILQELFTPEEVQEMKEAGIQMTKNIPERDERAVFNTIKSPQSKNNYFLESGDKISFFFEDNALNEAGELLVPQEVALNKVGHNLHGLHPIFQKYTYSEKIREVCWKLGMEDPLILQSMYIYKNPGIGSEVKPHQDETYLHTTPDDRLLGFWIALDDATIENGCLWFAPGSHKSGVHRRFIRNHDATSDQLLIYDKPMPTYRTSSFIATPVTKGSCVLIHGLVVHKSEHNKSDSSRHAYTFHVADSKDTTFSSDNWLQPPKEASFPRLYARPSCGPSQATDSN